MKKKNIENISTETDDDPSSAVVLWEEKVRLNSETRDKEMLKNHSNIAEKLQHYESQCKRYSLQKVELVQRCIQEERGVESCNLEHYGIGTVQCQIIFESFAKNPPTKLTSISLRNNHIEHFCCHAIVSYIQRSVSIKEMILEGCK